MTVFTTLGYGYYTPATDTGQWFVIFYGLIGIVTFGFAAESIDYLTNRWDWGWESNSITS